MPLPNSIAENPYICGDCVIKCNMLRNMKYFFGLEAKHKNMLTKKRING